MPAILTRFVRDQSGAITIEEGLAAFFFAIGIILILNFMGTSLGDILDSLRLVH
jgi:Flp pilus assembly pilin Flp